MSDVTMSGRDRASRRAARSGIVRGMRRVRVTTRRWLERLDVLVTMGTPQTPYGYDFSVNDMHVDEDAVCPVCLGWIAPHDIVRRTAYGPAQHEVCPLGRVPVTH